MNTPPTLTVLSLGGGVQSSVMALISRVKIKTRARHSRIRMAYTAFTGLYREADRFRASFTLTNGPIHNPHRKSD